MAEFKRSDKALKKDQNGARDVRREIGEEVQDARVGHFHHWRRRIGLIAGVEGAARDDAGEGRAKLRIARQRLRGGEIRLPLPGRVVRGPRFLPPHVHLECRLLSLAQGCLRLGYLGLAARLRLTALLTHLRNLIGPSPKRQKGIAA